MQDQLLTLTCFLLHEPSKTIFFIQHKIIIVYRAVCLLDPFSQIGGSQVFHNVTLCGFFHIFVQYILLKDYMREPSKSSWKICMDSKLFCTMIFWRHLHAVFDWMVSYKLDTEVFGCIFFSWFIYSIRKLRMRATDASSICWSIPQMAAVDWPRARLLQRPHSFLDVGLSRSCSAFSVCVTLPFK